MCSPALAGLALGASPSRATLAPPASATAPRVRVVAAENFWGNITAQIGGRDVAVTSLITNPNADPHLFETDAEDAAATWPGPRWSSRTVRATTPSCAPQASCRRRDTRTQVTAATVLHVSGSDPNPHLWYDIPEVPKVAAAIAAALSKAAPADAATFKANLATFDASLAPLNATLATIRTNFHGVGVAYTERVFGYALAVAGLAVKTPPGFARAIEDGVDPGPADTVAMQQLLDDHDVKVLLYNSQTVTPVTTEMARPGPPARHPRGRRLRDHAGGCRHLPAVAAAAAQRALARARAQPQPVTPADDDAPTAAHDPTTPPIELRHAAVQLGGRTLWSGLDLDVGPGEFLAVLGPNGTGKTTLLKVLLGLVPLSAGTVRVHGRPPRRGDPELGYVPQQRAFEQGLPIRGRDLVRFPGPTVGAGGVPLRSNRATRARVDELIEAVGAGAYAQAPVGTLSGGEQRRLRIARTPCSVT